MWSPSCLIGSTAATLSPFFKCLSWFSYWCHWLGLERRIKRYRWTHSLWYDDSCNPLYPTTWFTQWSHSGPDDVRGPCTVLNSLANYHLLPHSGQGITKQTLESALSALNVDSTLINTFVPAGMKMGKMGKDGIQVLDLSDLNVYSFYWFLDSCENLIRSWVSHDFILL